jgi:hypothetical protein
MMNVHKHVFNRKMLAQMFNNIYSESYCGGPAISLQNTVSLVQWSTVSFPPQGAAVRALGVRSLF